MRYAPEAGYQGKTRKGKRKKEVKGPYRSQSSNPKIRSEARPSEHRKEPVASAPAGPFPSESSNPKVRQRARKARRIKAEVRRLPVLHPGTTKTSPVSSTLKSIERAAKSAYDAAAGPPTLRQPSVPSGLSALQRLDKKAYEATLGKIHLPGPETPAGAALGTVMLATGPGAAAGLTATERAAQLASGASNVKTAAKLGERVAAKVKAAPKGATRVAKVEPRAGGRLLSKEELRAAKPVSRAKRNLAAHESNAAAKRAARRIRPKVRARVKLRAGNKFRDVGLRYGKEGRKVARRTRSVKVGLATPHVTATGAGVGALGVLGADIGGEISANQKKALPRTLELAPGLIVSTADLVAQAGEAVVTGNTKGLRHRLAAEADFAKRLASVYTSGDESKVRRFVEENGHVAPLLLAPSVAKLGGALRRHPTGAIDRAEQAITEGKIKGVAKRKARRTQLSKDAARAQAEATAEFTEAGLPVVRAYTGHRGKKGVKGRRQFRDKPVDRGDVMALVAEEGLTPTNIERNFNAVAKKWGDRPVFTDKRKGGVSGHDLIAYVRGDPGIWRDKAFWKMVERYRAQEPGVRRSERVVNIEQAKTHGVQLAEQRPTPLGRKLVPGVKSREDVAAFISESGEGGKRVRRLRETILAAEDKARELRAELKQLETGRVDKSLEGLSGLELGRRKQTVALLNRRRQQLLHAEADVRGMRAELVGTGKRHKAISQSLRDPAELAAARREFDAELAAVREDRGLAHGAYVPHTDVGVEGIGVAQPITRAGKKIYKRDIGAASLAERGRVDYSLPRILEAGIQAPRVRQHLHDFVNRAVQEGAIRVSVQAGKRVEGKRLVTREEAERGLTAEQKAKVTLFPLNQFKQAVKDENVTELEDLVGGLGREIDWRAEDKGVKYVVLPKDYAAELKAQLSAPGSGLHVAQIASRGISRTILASPAWALAQIVAEGLQAAHSINPLNPVNVYHFGQGMRGVRGMDPAKRREFRANAGALPGMGAGPREFFTASGKVDRGLADNFRRLERVMPIKRLLQAVRLDWLRAIDRAKGGEFRVWVAATKAHKDAYGFGKRLERLVKHERELSEKFAKMTPAERLEWSIRDTPAKRQAENYLDDVLGNWRAFSRKEKAFAPVAIFYNFLRMSLKWPFYSFPKNHPIRGAIMYEIAASHNNQLRQLLGGPPAWFGEYGTAILYGDEFKGGARLIKASRIVPGANAILEAISTGEGAAAGHAANPMVGLYNALINGIDPLTGEKVDPKYLSAEERAIARAGLATSVLLGLAPPLRAVDQLKGSKEVTTFPIIGPRRKRDALGNLLEDLNGTPAEKAVNTLFNPFPSADIDQARDRAAMGRIFEIWRTSGSDAQDAVKNNDSLSVKQKEKTLKEMKARTDEADAQLHHLYRKYDIAYKAEEKQALDEWSRLTYGKKQKTLTSKIEADLGLPQTNTEKIEHELGISKSSGLAKIEQELGVR